METQTAAAPPTAAKPVNPREVLQKILDGLGLQTKVEQYAMDGAPLLHITTAEPGRLIGKHGQTLGHLQFLVNRIVQRHDATAPKVIVDCERYRERANDELISRAIEAAEKVRRWGDSVHIGPFAAFERRVIHQHFAQDYEIEAVSEEGDETGRKKMTIRIRQTAPTAPGQTP
jgi:predicted RNA-binding protein Jag